ncbi:probable RNA helicase SDE3 [Coffea arabica]|uniref:Probable RNA helicase SDE3 n=1 Tax=Coffea arabica TaxID=13443 RepID=A0A6P6V132_COFAR|nr:probable RNA helicase SDE3 [Coffea arabica]XP_027096405.1 probable RNA helicase SDE3 [Coffea arabica]XP_027096406.1 probable RNA helicase SDE3 [Coffea arabica]XP_027096407.1 probable RNA helicase SDE3 [Coffea arabica]
MLAFLIHILKRICCVEDEEREINQYQNLKQSHYDFRRVPIIDSFPGSCNSLVQTTTPSRSNEVYNVNKSRSTFNEYLVPSKLSRNEVSKSVTSSTSTGIGNKNLIVASESTSPSSVHHAKQPSITAGPSEVLKSPAEITQNRNNLSSSMDHNPQICKRDATMPTEQKLSPGVSSASYKSFPSSTKLPHLQSSKLSPCESGTKKLHSFLETDSPSSYTKLADSCSQKPPPLSTKPVLSLVSTSSISLQTKTKYVWVEKGVSSTYVFPKGIRDLIEKDIVPGVLKQPLSMSTYMDYFQALLYAEDCHLEKWDGFEVKNVNLELHEASIYMRKRKHKTLEESDLKDEKTFVAFEIDEIPERRPFLLSRDFVSVQPCSRKIEPFQGVIYRVVKSNLVLAEFGKSFYSQHRPECKYDVKFSFNRVCLKRAHQAIADVSSASFRNFLFPDLPPEHEVLSTQRVDNRYQKANFAVHQILRLQGAPPYLVEGPMCISEGGHLSRTGVVIVEAARQILRSDPSKKILLCAPVNKTCDLLLRGLKKEMSDSDIFRANAAFREVDGIPVDILPSCLYERQTECFSCPPLEELRKFKIILSTFMSSFRLHSEGVKAGHFSHIFLVDASSATEPETMIPIANFANDKTIVVVTGAPRNRSGWVRSKIARQNGLMISYFERLRERELYKKLNPGVIMQLEDNSNERFRSLPAFGI